ncbi:hypothetical protein N2488_06620 [SAR92 clade bacterium H231]|jgi:hypothetical protein|nr:hypothetical protein [Porticoccaceae bacterium]MCT2532856.1 hypothetical protein [SAR92 clade bacterium H231]MBT6318738.1 hypothetical protein [Porticoccaceae bacterium]MBT7258039.1 hypothetical protein [Porticoccaceae bacterium]MBT7904624.1 hypothetical protein [Porticoccaceae bacterium]
MSKSGMHINISGGNAVIGNISQGHGSRLRAEQITNLEAADFDQFYQALQNLVADQAIPEKDYLALKTQVEELQQNTPQSGICGSLKALYCKYAWAAAPLKALLDRVIG